MTTTETPRMASEPTEPVDAPTRSRNPLSALLLRQELSLVLVIAIIAIATGSKNASFWGSGNISSILQNSVIYFVMACGAALVTIGGGLDFSVGAVFTFGALVTGQLLVHGVPWPLAVLGGLVAGAVVGVANHLVITYGHVPPIIATLGSFFILLGVNNTMTGGNDVLPLPQGFQDLAQNYFLGVSNMIWFAIVVGLIAWGVLEFTRFGVNVRALGGNRQAATSNGLRTRRIDLALYTIAGVTGTLAGIIYTSQIGAAQVTSGGAPTTLNVVTAVLIGGISLLGGLGGIPGIALGAILLSLIDNALVLAHIPPDYNNIVVGGILILAVAGDHLRRQRLYRKR